LVVESQCRFVKHYIEACHHPKIDSEIGGENSEISSNWDLKKRLQEQMSFPIASKEKPI
jgi:hypothetical protein